MFSSQPQPARDRLRAIAEKDEIRVLDGAEFDGDEHRWFVQPNKDLTPFKKWIRGERVWLSVPFDNKDVAKQRGAKWDPDAKMWYIFENQDPAEFAQWMPSTPASQTA